MQTLCSHSMCQRKIRICQVYCKTRKYISQMWIHTLHHILKRAPGSGKPRYTLQVLYLFSLSISRTGWMQNREKWSHTLFKFLKEVLVDGIRIFQATSSPRKKWLLMLCKEVKLPIFLRQGGEICGLEILLEDICPKFYTASKLLKLLMSSYGLCWIGKMS